MHNFYFSMTKYGLDNIFYELIVVLIISIEYGSFIRNLILKRHNILSSRSYLLSLIK